MERDDVNAFNEQWREIESRYNPSIVRITRIDPGPGAIGKIEFALDISSQKHPITGRASKFICHQSNDENLFETDRLTGEMLILPGFPQTRPKVIFTGNRIPKHINVFVTGIMCIGNAATSVLSIIFDNVFRACIYDPDPSVANYDSVADKDTVEWQKTREKSKMFPIINPVLLYRAKGSGLPPIVRADKPVRRSGLPPIRR